MKRAHVAMKLWNLARTKIGYLTRKKMVLTALNGGIFLVGGVIVSFLFRLTPCVNLCGCEKEGFADVVGSVD